MSQYGEIFAPILDRLTPDPVSLGVPVIGGAVQIGHLNGLKRGDAEKDRLLVEPSPDQVHIRTESGEPLQVELVDYDTDTDDALLKKVFVRPLRDGLALHRGSQPLRWMVDDTKTWVRDYEGLQEFVVMVGLFAARRQRSKGESVITRKDPRTRRS